MDEENEKRFESNYYQYVNEIYQFIYIRTDLNQTVAQDLTQDIFMAIYSSLPGFKGISSERTWIYKIARNKLNDFYRKKSHSFEDDISLDEVDENQSIGTSQDVLELQVEAFESQKVLDCLQSLSKKYRFVLTLKYLDEKSVKEIAHITGKSPKAIESLLQRAKRSFAKEYKKLEEELS